jgi:hypothetical protein
MFFQHRCVTHLYWRTLIQPLSVNNFVKDFPVLIIRLNIKPLLNFTRILEVRYSKATL